ncbi:hypothetical protein HOLleu_24636 [Holothuria leucospilota]|uniref:Uncharacterized protein n=1 Tax=Holothuria leucospilota TaxID=206669 RepID=A0A9Q1BRR3_HOLLE|nr:hypothetical protein HOLleu_24636 [Holothuria leucospilota]
MNLSFSKSGKSFYLPLGCLSLHWQTFGQQVKGVLTNANEACIQTGNRYVHLGRCWFGKGLSKHSPLHVGNSNNMNMISEISSGWRGFPISYDC